MNEYETRKQAKINRLLERAQKAENNSENRYKAAKQISSMIPFGQPILIGHHSENRHRRDLKKLESHMRKSIEESDKAEELRRRADAKEKNTAIFSDDPEAITKLKEKIKVLEEQRCEMKNINQEFRKHKGDETKMNVSDEVKEFIAKNKNQETGRGHWNPFETYQLSNLGQNIRTTKLRLKKLEETANDKTTKQIINNVTITDNVELNRLQIFFNEKPSEEIRKKLKTKGFRWSRYNGAWQRHRSKLAANLAKEIVLGIEKN